MQPYTDVYQRLLKIREMTVKELTYGALHQADSVVMKSLAKEIMMMDDVLEWIEGKEKAANAATPEG